MVDVQSEWWNHRCYGDTLPRFFHHCLIYTSTLPSTGSADQAKTTCIHFLDTEVKCRCSESDTSATFLLFRAICSFSESFLCHTCTIVTEPKGHLRENVWPVWASTTKIVFSCLQPLGKASIRCREGDSSIQTPEPFFSLDSLRQWRALRPVDV